MKESSRHETILAQAMLMIAKGLELPKVLESIVHCVEGENPTSLCTILVLDQHGTHLLVGAAPNLPDSYNQAIHGVAIGPKAGSCGTAAYLGKRVISENIQEDPLWEDYKDLAAMANVNSCWSEPIFNVGGQVLGTFAIYHRESHRPSQVDIEVIKYAAQIASIAIERKRSEDALKALAEERTHLLKLEKESRFKAERANRLKDEFLAILSHELRTPLTTILSWAQMLRTGKLSAEKEKRGLEILEHNAKAQGQLIDDLLDISRIQAGKLYLNIQRVDPCKLIDAAIESARSLATNKSIQIETEMDPSIDHIFADPIRIQQVLWNIITNAIKFSPMYGKIWIKLNRTTTPLGDWVEFQVRDKGKGIKLEFLPLIFDRFRQIDSTNTRTHGGLGLGLAIVKSLVEMHKGTVKAESQGEGEGSTFSVSLPMLPGLNDIQTAAQIEAEAKEEVNLCALKVLLVDDDTGTRDALSLMLQLLGAEVKSAESAKEAMTILQKFEPEVLVSDIAMPYENGYFLMRKVRALKSKVRKIPALALTALGGQEDIQCAHQAGFQAHMVKPVDARKLALTIARLGGRH